jgi:hypothetical protein
MRNLAICASTVATQPKAALRTAISVIFWSLVMPLIGFVIFAAMTVLPFIFVWLAPASTFFGILYLAGFVQSVITALFFQMIIRCARPLCVALATGLVSALTANLWWMTMMPDQRAKFADPSSYAYWALMAGAFGAALVMAVSGLRSHARRQSLSRQI